MTTRTIVFIATSLDGYIADKNGQIEWLETIPNPEQIDMGFHSLMDEIDAIVMGRKTFETVCGFGEAWPYSKPVFVLSRSLRNVPSQLQQRVSLLQGTPLDILDTIQQRGYHTLYIDGGTVIQDFLKADLIDELRITTIPILLGGGFSLFGSLPRRREFERVSTRLYLDQLVQNHYKRKRSIVS